MTFLALPAEETVFWVLVLGVVVVVVFGVLALIVTLLYFVRSVSGSLAELREVVDEQAAREDPAGREGAPPAGGSPGGGEGKDRERGESGRAG
ncbi:MAG: hypothetical protein ACRDSL_08040 [Pseudonocardiaceae bacterium]